MAQSEAKGTAAGIAVIITSIIMAHQEIEWMNLMGNVA
jgi:hypothetical protein